MSLIEAIIENDWRALYLGRGGLLFLGWGELIGEIDSGNGGLGEGEEVRGGNNGGVVKMGYGVFYCLGIGDEGKWEIIYC